MIVGNWAPVDHQFLLGFHLNADASHKNMELDLDFCGITGIGVFAFGTLLLARSFLQDQVSQAASSCEAEYYSYSKILSM